MTLMKSPKARVPSPEFPVPAARLGFGRNQCRKPWQKTIDKSWTPAFPLRRSPRLAAERPISTAATERVIV
jgi:hypothetical protein